MKLRELLEKVNLEKPSVDNPEDADSPCQMMGACGINFKKTPRIDGTGADFKMDNATDAIDAVKKLKSHKKIKKSFNIQLEKGTNTIKVFIKQ